jgi:predicted small lipoprotein YifL
MKRKLFNVFLCLVIIASIVSITACGKPRAAKPPKNAVRNIEENYTQGEGAYKLPWEDDNVFRKAFQQ